MNFERHLPKPKIKKTSKGAFMVRPPEDITKWLISLATKHHQSVNKIIVAILKEAKNQGW